MWKNFRKYLRRFYRRGIEISGKNDNGRKDQRKVVEEESKGIFRRAIAIKRKMQRSKTDEKMQQEEGKICRKKIEEKRRKNGHGKDKWTSKITITSEMEKIAVIIYRRGIAISRKKTTMEGRIVEKRC